MRVGLFNPFGVALMLADPSSRVVAVQQELQRASLFIVVTTEGQS